MTQESHQFSLKINTALSTGLYAKGLIYLGVPIQDEDYIVGKKYSKSSSSL